MAVRRDLTGSQQAVQALHAGIEAARSGLVPPDAAHPHLVLVGVADELDLELLSRDLHGAGVEHRVFREPDLGDSPTALATAPLRPEQRRLFRRHRLLELRGA